MSKEYRFVPGHPELGEAAHNLQLLLEQGKNEPGLVDDEIYQTLITNAFEEVARLKQTPLKLRIRVED